MIASALAFAAVAASPVHAQSFGGAGGYSTDLAVPGAGGTPGNDGGMGTFIPGGGGSGGGGGGSGAAGNDGDGEGFSNWGAGGSAGTGSSSNGIVLTGNAGANGAFAPPAMGFGGGGGGGGGGGAAGFTTTVTGIPNQYSGLTIIGGKGGDGGAGASNLIPTPSAPSGGGGGGGAGGYGVVLGGTSTLILSGTNVSGGDGGNGGSGGLSLSSLNMYAGGGNGGDGGTGVSVRGTATLSNSGIITGGNGGIGGLGGTDGSTLFYGGMGGAGGTGVEIADGAALINTGTITGGDAGLVGPTFIGAGSPPPDALAGMGVTAGSNTVVINSGAINAGSNALGVQGPTALMFTGGDNRLELRNGFSFQGNVLATAFGVTNTLALGGDTDSTFDVSRIVATPPLTAGASFYGFTDYEKTGASNWTLTGSTSAITNWTIKGGELVVSSDSNLGDPSGSVTLDGGALRMADGFNSARSFILGPSGGNLDTPLGAVATISSSLTGTGWLNKVGPGTLVLSGDSSGFAGASFADQGTMQVDGKLGGPVIVLDTGTLSGTGQVGETRITQGGTLAPGNAANPTGTLTVNGNLVLDSGSTFRVTAAADGSNSAVVVNGAATLGGSVVQIGSGAPYAAQTTYGILQATGGLTGQFSQVTSNLAYLEPTLAYHGNNVDLVVNLKQVPDDGNTSTPPADGGTSTPPANGGGTRDIRFADLASNGNQRATANALQSLPSDSPLYGRVLNLPNGAPAGVFQSLSGESHASAGSTLFGVADNVATLPLQHLHANLDAGMTRGQPTAQLGRGDASSLPQSAAQPVWAQVFGDWRTLGGSNGSTEVRQSDGGLFVGGDQHVGGGWRLGGALGYTGSHSSAKGLSSRTDIDSYSGVIYGGKAYAAGPGKINVSLGAGYTWHDIDTRRNVDAAGVDQSLKASYGGNTSQVFGELGYALPLTDRIGLEPFVGADYNDQRIRGFSESGGDAALSGKDSHNKVGSTTLGLRVQSTFESAGSQGRAYATAGWRHAYGDLDPATTLAFQGSQSFTVNGAPLARDAAVLSLGADLAVTRAATVGLAYTGQFGGGNRQNSGAVTVRWRF
ncbi:MULTISPECIES: autotransporter outer membrane beta-barrel domain-containing protein [unclassified Achromobacter]|uniref:autotransporter family protein n=1 Tax=unclassified Achromobacter TaxID=2626865 RepID=UPI000B518FC0|nr:MULTISPECIES: autotransporter outer membrane beta-barrel domain-containing protein [unclassified Achromobacter]OWT72890.1 hypothetical protein CEY05_23660 [Achromobacter sp. HZ34]OWT74108.1 hypothetical protein CEY04_22495 [Achromobacter sp. HZ28]